MLHNRTFEFFREEKPADVEQAEDQVDDIVHAFEVLEPDSGDHALHLDSLLNMAVGQSETPSVVKIEMPKIQTRTQMLCRLKVLASLLLKNRHITDRKLGVSSFSKGCKGKQKKPEKVEKPKPIPIKGNNPLAMMESLITGPNAVKQMKESITAEGKIKAAKAAKKKKKKRKEMERNMKKKLRGEWKKTEKSLEVKDDAGEEFCSYTSK